MTVWKIMAIPKRVLGPGVPPRLKMESASARIVKARRRRDDGREAEKVYVGGESLVVEAARVDKVPGLEVCEQERIQPT